MVIIMISTFLWLERRMTMKKSKAEEIIRGLSATSKKRLLAYSTNLSTDRDDNNYDKAVYELAMRYARNDSEIPEIKANLDSIGFTQACYQYEQIEDQIRRFEEPNHANFSWNQNYVKGKETLISQAKKWRLKVLDYDSDFMMEQVLPKKSTHPGFSKIVTGLKKKGEYLEGIFSEYKRFESNAVLEGSFNRPILIGSRTQASGFYNVEEERYLENFKRKSRLVSMVDVYEIFSELRFSFWLQHKLGVVPWYAGGKSDAQISARMRGNHNRYQHWYSIDYSHFDQSISDWLIYDAFDIVEAAFPRMTVQQRQVFEVVKRDFVEKVFIDGDGKCRYSRKGVPSGSMFTQIIDSIVNRLMILTYFISKFNTHDVEMMIMGDDNIIFTNLEVDLHDMETYLRKNFGVEMNADKCVSGVRGTDPHFLSRDWTSCGGDRPNIEVVAKLLFAERKRKYWEEEVKPELVLYSYFMAYPVALRRLIDVNQFKRDFGYLEGPCTESGYQFLSGNLAYRAQYESHVRSRIIVASI